MMHAESSFTTERAYEFLSGKARGDLTGTLCGLVFSTVIIGALGWAIHLFLARAWQVFVPGPLTLVGVVAAFYIVAYAIGALTAHWVRTDEHVESHLAGSTRSDDSVGEELAGGCLVAILQFVFGSFYTSASYVLQGGALPDRALRLAATIMSTLSRHPGLGTGELQQALEATGARIPPEDFRTALGFLRTGGFISSAGGWYVSPEVQATLS